MHDSIELTSAQLSSAASSKRERTQQRVYRKRTLSRPREAALPLLAIGLNMTPDLPLPMPSKRNYPHHPKRTGTHRSSAGKLHSLILRIPISAGWICSLIYILTFCDLFAAFERCSRGIVWILERNGWTLGIPCILETVGVSHGTTWEMRVCKQMVYDNYLSLLASPSFAGTIFANVSAHIDLPEASADILGAKIRRGDYRPSRY